MLCPNHHALKQEGSRPRELNARALHVIKQNQLELAGRYGDVERRVLEYFVRNTSETTIFLPGDFDVLLMHLRDAKLLEKDSDADRSVVEQIAGEGTEPTLENSLTVRQAYGLTSEGKSAMTALREARGLNSSRE